MPAKPNAYRHLKAAYRSGLESVVAAFIATCGVEAGYEAVKIPFEQPAKSRTYMPDFALPNGIIIETKGLFTNEDRQKHLWVKAQHPDLDIRLVFSNAGARLTKGSPTTYKAWCEKHGFKWAHKYPPKEWLMEAPDDNRIAAVERLRRPNR